MAGYFNWSMSNNAVNAYCNGVMPYSKWKKTNILEAISHNGYPTDIFENWNLKELKTLLCYKEWHHTGGDFKRTDFYSIDTDLIEEYLNGRTKPVIKSLKRNVDYDDGFYHGKYKVTEYHPTSRYNKYKEWFVPFENCRKKGCWLILPDGSRKKFESCVDVKHTKYRRKKKI